MMKLILCIIIAILVILLSWQVYQKKKIQQDIESLTRQLCEILENHTDQKVMLFTDLKAINDLICQLNYLLEDRQKTRADFLNAQNNSKKMLSNISHDLKTPLTVILGYLELLTDEPSPQRERLLKVQKKSLELYHMVEEFFHLSKLESDDINLKISKQNISEICRQTLLDFYDVLTGQDFCIDLSIPDTPVFVLGDSDAIRRILTNLISNVLRYGAEGKYLGCSVKEEADVIYVEIIDHGKGIPAKSLPYIFDRLYTTENSGNRGFGGSGLGLAISKALAQKMNGDLLVSSIPNQKTVFTLQLERYISQERKK